MLFPPPLKPELLLMVFCLSLAGLNSAGQSTDNSTFGVSGYVKGMGWTTFTDNFHRSNSTGLLHNRLNAKWQKGKSWEARLELRNRIFYGDDIRFNPDYGKQLSNDNFVDLDHYDASSSLLYHTNVERGWIQFKSQKWIGRAGRQRINWGMATIWNPNDIFNYYNFLDFDYEERSGADALKATFFPDGNSSIEAAVAKTKDDLIYAGRYQTNLSGYDLQLLAGSYKGAFTAGMGWAGNIGQAGFKGEMQYFGPNEDTRSDLFTVVQVDHLFGKGWYFSSTALFNQRGKNESIRNGESALLSLSPRMIMPARWNFVISGAKELSPIFNAGWNVLYSPGLNMLILFPNLRYNLRPNIDLDLFWQSFYFQEERFDAKAHTAFLRMKWNF